jgi:hypothetical protein
MPSTYLFSFAFYVGYMMASNWLTTANNSMIYVTGLAILAFLIYFRTTVTQCNTILQAVFGIIFGFGIGVGMAYLIF